MRRIRLLASLLLLLLAASSPAWAQSSIVLRCVLDSTNTCVQVGDNANSAIRVNVVAGGAGGTSSSFGAAFPGTGTAAGARDTAGNMQSLSLDGAGVGANLQVNVSDRAARLVGQVEGRAASGGAKAGNPVQVGGVFNTTQPTVTTGQAVEAQATARGGLLVATGVDTFNATINAALPTGANTIGAVTQAGGPWTSNVTQFGGTALSTGAGAGGLGIPRVTVSNDSTVILGAGAATIGALAANQSVNLAQVAGTATVTGGVAGLLGVAGAAASGAAKSGNPLQIGGVFNTVQPTVLTGQAVEAQATARGALISATGADVFNVTVNTALPTGANTIGTVTANQGGAPWTQRIQDGVGAPLATVTAANALKTDGSAVTQPVSLAAAVDVSDRTARLVGQVEGRAASGAAKAGNPNQIGGVFNTTQPTVTTGQAVEAQATARGALIVASGVDNTAANSWFARITDATNTAAVKAASTSAALADPSLVVQPSPSPSPVCTSVVNINQTAGTQLVTGTAAQFLYICSFVAVSATAQSISLVEGTGATCATGIAGLIGGTTASMALAANGGLVVNSTGPWLKSRTAADNLCLLQSGAGNVSGVLTYVSRP